MFSGHIDSWHYGAMDNGSANATMLETLRALLPHRNEFRRSLRLAFWSGHSTAGTPVPRGTRIISGKIFTTIACFT